MNIIDANSSLEMECKGPVGGQRERMAGMFMTSMQGLHRGLRWQEDCAVAPPAGHRCTEQ